MPFLKDLDCYFKQLSKKIVFEESKKKKQLFILGVICHPLNLQNSVCADAYLQKHQTS